MNLQKPPQLNSSAFSPKRKMASTMPPRRTRSSIPIALKPSPREKPGAPLPSGRVSQVPALRYPDWAIHLPIIMPHLFCSINSRRPTVRPTWSIPSRRGFRACSRAGRPRPMRLYLVIKVWSPRTTPIFYSARTRRPACRRTIRPGPTLLSRALSPIRCTIIWVVTITFTTAPWFPRPMGSLQKCRK